MPGTERLVEPRLKLHGVEVAENRSKKLALAIALSVLGASIFLSLRPLPYFLANGWGFIEVMALALSATSGLLSLVAAMRILLRSAFPAKENATAGALGRGTALGIAIAAWSCGLGVLDILARHPPFALLLGGTVLGLACWRQPELLAILSLVSSATCVLVSLAASAFSLEILLLLGLSGASMGIAALAIRLNLMPDQERLRSLEAENFELRNLSFHDALTGLHNRRYAAEAGLAMFNRAQRYHEELHVLMIDIDHFKKVNDKLGHAVGDIVLRGVAELIKVNARASDMTARYGGEEFVIFLIGAGSELVQFIANRIRDSIANHAFAEVPWQITVSIGVAGIETDDTIEALIDRADKFLYLSKGSGRNRVSGY